MGAIDTDYTAPPEQLDPTQIETPLIVTDPLPPARPGPITSADLPGLSIEQMIGLTFEEYKEELIALKKEIKDLKLRIELLEMKMLSK